MMGKWKSPISTQTGILGISFFTERNGLSVITEFWSGLVNTQGILAHIIPDRKEPSKQALFKSGPTSNPNTSHWTKTDNQLEGNV